MRFVHVAVSWEEKRVSGEREGKQTGGDFTLLLEDHIGECAAIDGERNGGAQVGGGEGARVGNCERKQRNWRRDDHGEMFLLCVTQLLRWHFDDVGATYTEIEPLITNGFASLDFDFVEEWTAFPARIIRDQCQNAI